MDLDGVISPVPTQAGKVRIQRDGRPAGYRTWPGAVYDMFVDERLADWAGRLDRAFDVVWSSAWGQTLLPAVAEPLGLDHWPILTIPPVTDGDEAGTVNVAANIKAHAIAAHLRTDARPFAWCDDFLDRRSLPNPLRALGLPHLLVRPNSRRGLTPAHIDLLLKFAHRNAGQ